MATTLTSDFYDIVTFPSCKVRDMACRGVINGLRQHVREFEMMGWLESRFALAVCAKHYGESDGEMEMIEAELKAIYISAGVVAAMQRITGKELSADDLLAQITLQVQTSLMDA
jgi:hypothetical protein